MEENLNSLVVLKALKSDIWKPQQQLIFPETLSGVYSITPRPCFQQFSLELLCAKEIAPRKTANSEVCGLSWVALFLLLSFLNVIFFHCFAEHKFNSIVLGWWRITIFWPLITFFVIWINWTTKIKIISSLCFLIRGHLPLLMVCSTRRQTGTTVMVTTGASTVRGATDSDLQVGSNLFVHIFTHLVCSVQYQTSVLFLQENLS